MIENDLTHTGVKVWAGAHMVRDGV